MARCEICGGPIKNNVCLLCRTKVTASADKILTVWLKGDLKDLEALLKNRSEHEFGGAVMNWLSQKDEKTLAKLLSADIKIEDFAVEKMTSRRKTLVKAYLESIEKLKSTVKGVGIESLPIQLSKSYLVKEERPTYSFQLFETAISAGFKGLCITRQNPQELFEKYNISGAQIYRLQKLPAENYLDPGNLVTIANLMKDHIKGKEKSIILLEGVEYLISNNGFQHVLNMIEYITEYVSNSSGSLVISANPAAFVERELALLEKDLIPIATQPFEKITLAPLPEKIPEKAVEQPSRRDLATLKYRKKRKKVYAG